MKWRNVLWVAVFTLPVIFILALGFGHDPHEVPSVLPGKLAPNCQLTDLQGKPTSIVAYRGKPVVINFWSTWCVPCEAEHGVLQQAAQNFGERAQFLGVVYQDEAQNAERYLKRKGSTYPQLIDPSSRCAIDYGVAGVPESFFVDPNGIVADKHVGPIGPADLARAVNSMLPRGTP